jgi:hypothetical protein
VLVLLIASCTGEGGGEPTPTETIPRGGTLRVELFENPDALFTHLTLDQQRAYWYSEWELSVLPAADAPVLQRQAHG